MEDTDRYTTVPSDDNIIMDNGLVVNLVSKKNLVAVDSLLSEMMSKGVHLESYVITKIIESNSIQGREKGALLAYIPIV